MSEIWRRFAKHRLAVTGLGVVVGLAIMASGARQIAPHDPLRQDLPHALAKPSAEFPLGTDEFGRCILSRILFGARLSLLVGVIATAIGATAGILLGLTAGYFPRADAPVMRCMDVLLAFPGIFLALGIIAALGPGLVNLMFAAGISSIPQFARIVRASILSLKEREFVEAALALGSGSNRIMFRHLLPNCLAPIIVQSTLRMATVLLTASGLSFLGLGVQPPMPEWGAMLSNSRSYLIVAPHVATIPGLAIMVVVVGFNLFGDGLRDTLDPRLRQ